MKRIFILLMLIVVSGSAYAQGAINITNGNYSLSAEITLYATSLSSGDGSACSIISNVNYITLGTCCGSSSMYYCSDACSFQSTIGWSSIAGGLSCPTIPSDFQWTDAVIVLKGCGSSTTINVGNPMLSTCFSETTYVSGSVGMCSYSVRWTTGMAGVVIEIM